MRTRPATDRADLRLRAFDRVLRRVGPDVGSMTLEELRQLRRREIPDNRLVHLVFGRPARHVEVIERRIDEHPWSIPLRIYRPRGATGVPVVVFFHGGGWVIGNVAQSTWMCGQIAQRVGAVVVSAGYRLAPEHRFPAAVEDTYAGLCWISAHAGELGGDATRLAVMGASAGGNLAAVACQRARDEGGPAIVHQTLLYPSVDITPETPPRADLDDAPLLPRADRITYLNHYTRVETDPSDPRLSPLRAASLAGLPPALVITAEHDPLRDEGRRYAERLRAEGNPPATPTTSAWHTGSCRSRAWPAPRGRPWPRSARSWPARSTGSQPASREPSPSAPRSRPTRSRWASGSVRSRSAS